MKASLCAQMLVLAMVVMATPVLAQTASGGSAPTTSPMMMPPASQAGGGSSSPIGGAGGPPGGGHGGPHEACMSDAKTFCKGVEPGQGRIIQCLKSHDSELSAGCKAAIAKGPPHHPPGGLGAPGGHPAPPEGGEPPSN